MTQYRVAGEITRVPPNGQANAQIPINIVVDASHELHAYALARAWLAEQRGFSELELLSAEVRIAPPGSPNDPGANANHATLMKEIREGRGNGGGNGNGTGKA